MMHIDDFIDDESTHVYASFVFQQYRLNASLQNKFAELIPELLPLYCTFRTRRYKVNGCSSLGDVWLVHKSSKATYDCRVDVIDCSEFTNTLEPVATELTEHGKFLELMKSFNVPLILDTTKIDETTIHSAVIKPSNAEPHQDTTAFYFDKHGFFVRTEI